VCRHDMLVDADDSDAVEPVRIVDQHALAFGQDRVVGGVPRHPDSINDTGQRQVLHHQALRCPAQPAAGQLRPRLRRLAGVLAPHMMTLAAAVAAGWWVATRTARAPTCGPRAARDTLAAAGMAPVVRLDHPARQQGTIRVESLASHDQPELVRAAEHRQVRTAKTGITGSVVQRRGLPGWEA